MTIRELIDNHKEQQFQYASALFNQDAEQAAYHLKQLKILREQFPVIGCRASLASRLDETVSDVPTEPDPYEPN